VNIKIVPAGIKKGVLYEDEAVFCFWIADGSAGIEPDSGGMR
jgi:hypothetical protein